MRRKSILIAASIIAFLQIAFVAGSAVNAEDDVFAVRVKHNINGKSLGLSKDLPVIAHVSLDGEEIAAIPLDFKDTFSADLPAGTYVITVESVELGAEIPSMTLGPVSIPPGANVAIVARLSREKTPILDVH